MVSLTCAMLVVSWGAMSSRADEPTYYERHVKPILAARCYACHGVLKQEADLRLDAVALMLEAQVIEPGDADQSALVERVIEADPELRMPPGEEGAPLTADEVAHLRQWIAEGAQAPANDKPEADPSEHWSFVAPVRPDVPQVATASGNPIDAFLEEAQRQRGLTTVSEAEPALLLRRLYLDLTGLPPGEEQLNQFLADPSREHYERIVDRLLDDPRHAERWTRHWMDVWRYSDWWGLGAEVRNSQKHIWHWRDWIIESVDADVGYDEMVRLMLAADELAPDDPQALRATGYLARQYFRFNRDTWLDETIEHTGKAFLGLTLNCSRCHDHKYDPFTTHDYYQLRAFFEPYQVRTDLVPGQVTVEADGIPRAFDCRLDAPTYRYIRGDAKMPVTDEPLQPAVPPLLAFDSFAIEPIDLPVEAHHPGVQPWVVEAYMAQGQTMITQRRAELSTAEQALAAAREREAARLAREEEAGPEEETPAETVARPVFTDEFRSLDAAAWRMVAGEWEATDAGLEQRSEATERSALEYVGEVPTDFEARFQFTIQGGPMWRSVGLVFDATEGRELLAYASAYAGGPKVQMAFKNGGDYQYPNDAQLALPFMVDQSILLTVRCRGDLINVDVDGKPALTWRSTIGRTPGALRLITFDALARFERFELAPLDPTTQLRDAANSETRPLSLAEAEVDVELARLRLRLAELEPARLEASVAADRAQWARAPLDESTRDQIITTAAQWQRRQEHLEAVIRAWQAKRERAELLATQPAATPEMLGAIDQKIATAEQAAADAEQRIADPGTNYVSLRGSFKTIESPVETAESVAAPFPTTSTGRRRALAYWLTDRRNPLTARVAVNHIWARHFGAPIVPTIFDFGRKGLAPTHPELLDWLAVEFMDNGWSMKHLHRLMVTSDAYRRGSSIRGNERSAALDPENRWLWRMNPIRMEAQAVRDSLLALAGQLDETRGGPSVPLSEADQSRRRSLYFVHSHNEHHRFLSTFDDAAVQECYRRETSIVPQQALALSNSRVAIESAQAMARQWSESAESSDGGEPAMLDDDAFIHRAFLNLLGFAPNERELEACRAALSSWNDLNSADTLQSRQMLVLSLINHNDFVTIR